jgi:hypothetical protein
MTYRKSTRISVLDVLPTVGNSRVGDIVYLTTDDKLYIRRAAGWVSSTAYS